MTNNNEHKLDNLNEEKIEGQNVLGGIGVSFSSNGLGGGNEGGTGLGMPNLDMSRFQIDPNDLNPDTNPVNFGTPIGNDTDNPQVNGTEFELGDM